MHRKIKFDNPNLDDELREHWIEEVWNLEDWNDIMQIQRTKIKSVET